MLKENGKVKRNKNSKQYEYTQCKVCKKKLLIEELEQDGYIEEVSNVKIINCPYCDGSFQY